MATPNRARAALKLAGWTAVATTLVALVVRSHASGQMAAWYYHRAAADGYAVRTAAFADASPDLPARLEVGDLARVDGLQAVRVRRGDRLPVNADGVILDQVLADGRRARLEGRALVVAEPSRLERAWGVAYHHTFRHEGVETWPWAAAWNVAVTLGLGLSLGFMAEGLTDLIGLDLEKIRHHGGP